MGKAYLLCNTAQQKKKKRNPPNKDKKMKGKCFTDRQQKGKHSIQEVWQLPLFPKGDCLRLANTYLNK